MEALDQIKQAIQDMPQSEEKHQALLGYMNLLTLSKLSEAMAKPEVKDEN